jgi:hypothetical protein
MVRAVVPAFVVVAALTAATSPGGSANQTKQVVGGPLRTAFVDPMTFGGATTRLPFGRARSAGATHVRLILSWRSVARGTVDDASDPDDPGYFWRTFDRQVRNARASGLTPIATLLDAPQWARDRRAGGETTTWPRIQALARFAEAAALRYSGYYEGAPKIRFWQVWNEPNARSYLRPQFVDRRAASPARYRRMLEAVARGVRRVDSRNVIVAGGLSPFGHNSREIQVIAPLRFMRQLLCVSKRYEATCPLGATFDVWGHHPYTSGGPRLRARAADNVSIGDLPEMRRLLDAAIAAGHVRARADVEFWVTEFSWDTKPDDPVAVPLSLHARWVAEALYRMWQARVSLVTWFLLRDMPLASQPYQSGLWFNRGSRLTRDRPKLSVRAFRFPFVAYRVEGGVSVWGRVPHGRRGRVAIERETSRGWTRLATFPANRYGIFQGRIKPQRAGPLRALWIARDEASLPFSLTGGSNRRYFPFGCGGRVRCPGSAGSE